MKFLLYISFFLFSFGQLLRVSLFEKQVNFYLYEISLALFSLVFYITNIEKIKLIGKKICQQFKPVLFFLFVLLISLFIEIRQFNKFQNLIGFFYFLRLILYFSYFFSLYFWLKNKNNLAVIKNSLKIFVYLTVISTLIQYFLYPNLRNLMYLGWDPHWQRTFGVFFDTVIAGSIYGLVFFLNNNLFIKLIYLLFLIFSYSRNIYLGFFLAIFYLLFFNKKYFLILSQILIFVFILIFIPRPLGEGGKLLRVYTIKARLDDYKKAINFFSKKPVFGYGYNRIRYIKNEFYSNAGAGFSSSYLTILIAAGLLGLIGYLNLLYFFWKKFKKSRIILLFLIFVSLFDNVFFHPFILFLFFTSLFDR